MKSGIQRAGIKLEKVGINYVKLWIKGSLFKYLVVWIILWENKRIKIQRK